MSLLSRVLPAVRGKVNVNIGERTLSSFALVYKSVGDPQKVIEKVPVELKDDLNDDEVLVQFIASPINPADINTIQGVYAVKPPLPAVGGNEGVASVVKVGPRVTNLKVNDWVIPGKSEGAFGTWRTHCIGKENDFFPLVKGLDKFSAAQLSVNPCTAYRMLKDFVSLKPGDSLIQNGANSAVGINVIQLAREWKIKTINVVRDRPGLDTLKEELKGLGANHVVTEEELRQEVMNEIWKAGTPKPKLALNCVGGKNATDCLRHLDFRGTMVTYGGMSRQPVIIPTGSLIFRDQAFKGYWMSRWITENGNSPERTAMIEYLCGAMKDGKLKSAKAVPYKLDDFKDALSHVSSARTDGKVIFDMN